MFQVIAMCNSSFAPGWIYVASGRHQLILYYKANIGAAASGGMTLTGSFQTLQVYPEGGTPP